MAIVRRRLVPEWNHSSYRRWFPLPIKLVYVKVLRRESLSCGLELPVGATINLESDNITLRVEVRERWVEPGLKVAVR